jgi:hypothetical protein
MRMAIIFSSETSISLYRTKALFRATGVRISDAAYIGIQEARFEENGSWRKEGGM